MKLFTRLAILATLGAAAFGAGWKAADAQPAQWNYTFVGGVATATYPGNVSINGVCTVGCSSVSLSLPNTWTATQTFAGSASTIGIITPSIGEPVAVTAAAPAATENFNVLSGSVKLYTVNAANNWTLNIRGDGSHTLNSMMLVGQALTLAMITTEGATPFYNNAVTIDGVSVTPKWQGVVPTTGNANALDTYTYTIIKTASAVYTVLASQVPYT